MQNLGTVKLKAMKVYKFKVAKSTGEVETYEKKENELNQKELELLFGELLQVWNRSPSRVQTEFFSHIGKVYKAQVGSLQQKYAELQKKVV